MASAIMRAQTDAVWFARDILNLRRLDDEPSLDEAPDMSWELDAWQVRMLEAASDVVRKQRGEPTKVNHDGKHMLSVVACQGPGKTFGAAMLLHWFAFCFKGVMLCTAPKVQQVTTRLFKEFTRIQARAIPGYASLMTVTATRITWANDREWFAIAETGKNPMALQGYHDQYMLIIVDEASGVDDEMAAVIRGAMSTGTIVISLMIGNPNRADGFFARSHRRADLSGDYFRMQISYKDSKRVKREWVEQMEREYGRNSPVVKIRCYGEFVDTDELQLIAPEWIVEATEREWSADGDGTIPRMRLSIDVADGGDDETVFTLCRHWYSRVEIIKQYRRSYETAVAVPKAYEEAVRLWSDWGMSRETDDIVVDSMGVGSGVAGLLLREGLPTIVYKGGESATVPTMYRNRRVQSYIAMRNAFRDGQVLIREDAIDDIPQFQAQLCSVQLRPGSDSRVEDLVTKAEMKRDGIKSPDMADSLAMQFATKAPTLLPAAPIGASLEEQIDVEPLNVLRGYVDV